MQSLLREHYFEKIVTQSPLGIALFDQQGKWLHYNAALLKLLGYTKKELAQTSFLITCTREPLS